MSTGLVTLPKSTSVDSVIEVLERDGGVIIDGFANENTLTGLWDDIGPALADQPPGEGGFVGSRTKRLSSLFRRSMHSATLIEEPHFFAAAEHFLRRPVTVWFGDERTDVIPTMQVGVSQAIQIGPGEGAQELHRDDILHLRPHPGPQTRVQFMFAMSDFTETNGATLAIPGSHKWDDDRQPTRAEAVPAVMGAGSALVWLGSTYHAGGENRSDGPRTGLTYALDVGNVRQEENQYLAVPLDVVRQYPERIQRLLGYEACPPFCGWYEMNNPLVLLQGTDGALAAQNLIASGE